MAAAQLPPLQFEEGGLQIVLLPSNDKEEKSSLENPFADSFQCKDDDGDQHPESADSDQVPHGLDHEQQDLAAEPQTPSQKQTKPSPLQQDFEPDQQTLRLSPHQEQTALAEPQLERPDYEPPLLSPQASETENRTDRSYTEPSLTGDDSAPLHPIPTFQAAFAESLREATEGTTTQKPNLQSLDAKSRRELLLSQEADEEPFDSRWRYRPGQTQHEVMKLVAQISFGVYLMFNGMANSNSQVIGILQGHIDEIDEFLEVAVQDLDQAIDDLTKRISHLKLPMENITVFEQLLEDRRFRAEILDGNERIDRILTRTNVAMAQWDDDIEAGLRASTLFASWLNEHSEGEWRNDQPDLVDVYDAMKGNTEGWLNAFEDMNNRAQEVNGLVMTLMTIITEMESRAGEVSRRTWTSVQPFSTPTGSSIDHSGHKTIPGASPSPPPSRHSNTKSPNHSDNHAFEPNPLSLTPSESNKDDDEDDDDIFFPLPGYLPLLPPPTRSQRDAASVSSKPRSETVTESPTVQLADSVSAQEPLSDAASEEPSLYILQPRTYTPQLPAPVLSPRLSSSAEPPAVHKRSSLRDRISNPPTSIHIPPTSTTDSPLYVPSTSFGTPRSTSSMQDLRSTEPRPTRPPLRGRVTSPLESSSSGIRTFTPSPMSERHTYQPVRASPHSPLQQRPHTAAGPPRLGGAQTAHKPTPLGAMTNLSTVMVAHPTEEREHERGHRSSAISHGADRQGKKKKSAFGWFKKAFTMDEDERMAFEMRRAGGSQGSNYYDANTPRFLDGKRIR